VKTKKARHTARRTRQLEVFLAELAGGATVTDASRAAGMHRRRAYEARKADAEFRKAWEEAEAAGTDALLKEARRRAVDGVERLVLFKGMPVKLPDGTFLTEREYSDSLLITLLKARRPAEYCDKARLAALERKWARADAKRAEKANDDGADLSEILDGLNAMMQMKRAIPLDEWKKLAPSKSTGSK
jgi:hypothetical protein